MNPNKTRGDRAERAVRDTLRTLGFPHAERTRAGHPDDHADLWADRDLLVQVKDVGAPSYGVWLDQTEQQRAAAGARRAILVHKRRGVADPQRWYAVLTLGQMAELLRAAGHGSAVEEDE